MVIGGTGPETEEEKEKLEASREKSHALGLEDASNPDFKSRLDHFLKLLEFLQDVLRRNIIHETAESGLDASMLVGTAIVQSILDAVRRYSSRTCCILPCWNVRMLTVVLLLLCPISR